MITAGSHWSNDKLVGTLRRYDKAGQYILKITNGEGWTQYNIHSMGGGRGSSALTGAGMTILNALGLQENPKYRKGIANVMASAPFLRNAPADGGWQTWYYYAAFYCTLAIFQSGGEDWQRWWPALRDDLVKRQSSDGSWMGQYGSYGPLWSAMACLTLEIPNRLPIDFRRHVGGQVHEELGAGAELRLGRSVTFERRALDVEDQEEEHRPGRQGAIADCRPSGVDDPGQKLDMS